MNLISKIDAAFDCTIGRLAFFAAILIVFITLVVCMEVIARFALGGSIPWVIEVVEYCLLWITFLGTAWVLKRERHVRMDMVVNRLNPKNQALLNIITSIVSAIVCLVITWYAAKVTWDHFQGGYTFSRCLLWPSYPILAIIPVGSFLLFIQFLRRGYGYLRDRRASGDKEPRS